MLQTAPGQGKWVVHFAREAISPTIPMFGVGSIAVPDATKRPVIVDSIGSHTEGREGWTSTWVSMPAVQEGTRMYR